MKSTKRFRSILPLAMACAIGGGSPLRAVEPDPREAEIFKAAEGYVEAFHKGDAKAVAAFWTPDGDYVDDTGRVLKGRAAIEESFAELFAENKGLKLRIDVADLKFPGPDLAIEDGTSAVIAPDGSAPSRARYTNVLVKQDGKWLLSSVREAADEGPSNYELLRVLEWTIGEWIDDAAAGELGHVSFGWGPGRNFIVSTRTMDFKDTGLLQSTEWIGWDASAKKIRSWNFQADGGFGESTWTQDGDKWVIQSESVLADGSKITSNHVVAPGDAGTLTWQSKNQKVNGQALPDITAVKMKRVR